MIRKTFPARVDALREAASFLEDYLNSCKVPQRVISQLNVAMEELFVNVAHYAYPDRKGTVTLELEHNQDNEVTLRIIDDGVPFNPLERPDPDISLPVEDRPIGGLGIYVVKKTMDHLSYENRNNQNILTIKKDC